MSDIARTIGKRIRYYRNQLGLSQEKLAELAGCHATYVGQVERGEKNLTVESIEKIAGALNLPLSQLFEKLGPQNADSANYPLACYELVAEKNKTEQECLYGILREIEHYKNL